MGNIFSKDSNGVLERWVLKLELDDGKQPSPNIEDFGRKLIIINYCLYTESQHKVIFSVPPDIKFIEPMEKNSIMFDSEGGLPWQVLAQCSMPLEFPITKKEYEKAYSLVVWADPFGSAAFFGGGYWKGVLIIKEISKFKTEEIVGNTKKNIINIKLQVAQSVISYFIDLVEKYTTSTLPELKEIHDAYKNGDKSVLGKLGVMAPTIDKNNTVFYRRANNTAEFFIGDWGTDLYDGDYWIDESLKAKDPSNIEWGDSNISIYDFKAPIKKLYAEMIRIGNDGRIYSNEGFSNLNWGIVGYQLELGSDRMIEFAHMDPSSGNQDHDDAATRDGQRAGESAGISQKNHTDLPAEFPRALDRRKLFLFITKVLSENDLYTTLGVLKHQKALEEQQAKDARENPLQYSLLDYPLFW
ncbi:hypothetical protein [Rahnella woolbedingensis]|uniref:Uncharacterized protein n=1 Tax=Rahnella woolbedingensis TaxID=1510574 RepID=A0A419N6V6_9GAMM|nr:hypothetical protein [Rahnella woolbedingensis]RJT43005.1 hypothetical protein D6C13_15950 [Rahnella woolbedingensis]